MIELHNGDAYKLIKNIPDNSVDLIVTDPPYLIESTDTGSKSRLAKSIQNMNNQLAAGVLTAGIKDDILEQYYGVSDSVVIPNNVIEIGDFAFDGCKTLLSVSIPSNVTEIGDGAFMGCESLKSICIPDGVMEIHSSTFSQCILLESISIPKSVRIIEDNAFSGCASLSSIVIPDGVIKIYAEAFWSCMSLVSITLPASVTEIGDNAFCECQSLKEIHYAGTRKQWNALAKGNKWNIDVPEVKVIFDSDATEYVLKNKHYKRES